MAQNSFLTIGGINVVVALMSVGQMSVALTSVAKTSVGEKLRHQFTPTRNNKYLFVKEFV